MWLILSGMAVALVSAMRRDSRLTLARHAPPTIYDGRGEWRRARLALASYRSKAA